MWVCVVPANAGTHNPGRWLWRTVSATVPKRDDTAYGSRRSPGRRERKRASAIFRPNIPQLRRMRGEIVQAVGQMHALVRGGTLLNRQSRAPFRCGPNRPRDKTAAAVRAYIVQLVLDAVRTECAFVRADARFHCMRRKILIAIFAVWPELQRHGRLVG